MVARAKVDERMRVLGVEFGHMPHMWNLLYLGVWEWVLTCGLLVFRIMVSTSRRSSFFAFPAIT